jgi:hypothetical protein
VNTRLVSFQGPMPAVVRYRYQDDVLGERAPVVPPAPPVPPVTAVPAMQGGPAMRAVPAQPGPPRRAENP